MQITYKFRLYPNRKQEEKMLEVLDKCRFVYNKLLEELSKQEKINRRELQHSILKIKEENQELYDVYSKILQYENYRLFSNLRALSKLKKNGKKVGKLRFKGKWFKTFVYNQSGFKIIKTNKRLDRLQLSKIGEISIRIHREIEGKIKQIIVKHCPSGKWYACLCCEQNSNFIENPKRKAIGIDLGTMNFIYDSEGNHINHPKFLVKSLDKLTKEQRKLSNKRKYSENRERQKIKVARIYEKIVNQRGDFLHKLSKKYIDSYGIIAIEKLNIMGLVRKAYKPRNMLDASWSRFIQFLIYKAERAGCQIVEIEPRGTTQKCSNCEKEVPKKLWNRIHKCDCGLVIDRDYNSAINILKLGLERASKAFGVGSSTFS